MAFKKISSIISDAKYSFGNNPYDFFQLLIVCSCVFDPNANFWRPFLKRM